MKGFKNVIAYVENEGLVKCDVAVEKGKIAAVGKNLDISEPFPCRETDVVLPGFIDQHVHGANGADAMDGNAESLSKIADALAQEGTTAFLATTMTQSAENIKAALRAVKNYVAANPRNGARIAGVHLEGPFISEKHIGAQPLTYLSDPVTETFDEYFKESGGLIKIATIAPEERGADELIRDMASKGVHPSAGHTDAGYNDVVAAMNAGLDCVTHTYNAQRGLHHREIGVVGAAFLLDGLYAEAICDLVHLSIPAVKLLVKNKPKDKLILVTDSMRAKYLPDGEGELGGQKVIVKSGEARLINGALAGSILKMNDAVKNLVLKCDVPFLQAVDYCTANPAKHLGIFGETGSIKTGKAADFCVLSDEFEVRLTVRGGNVVYQSEE